MVIHTDLGNKTIEPNLLVAMIYVQVIQYIYIFNKNSCHKLQVLALLLNNVHYILCLIEREMSSLTVSCDGNPYRLEHKISTKGR
jgi:hypothetical protein